MTDALEALQGIFHEAWDAARDDQADFWEWASEARAEAGFGAVSLGYSVAGGHVHEAMDDAVRGCSAPAYLFDAEDEILRTLRRAAKRNRAADDALPF